MNCPNCGTDGRGAFCRRCGARLDGTVALTPEDLAQVRARAAANAGHPEADSPGRRPDHVSMEAPHVRLHAPTGSFAAEHLEQVAKRMESAYRVSEDTLGGEALMPPIDVYLEEEVIDLQGRTLDQGGYALPSRMEIREVYRTDAPGTNLDHSLLSLLLALRLGLDTPPSGFLVDGLAATVMQRLGRFPSESENRSILLAARKQKELPALSTLLTGSEQAPPTYLPAAASFARFLLDSHGIERMMALLASPQTPERWQSVYGQDLRSLEKAWHKSLKSGSPGGVTGFVRLVGPYLRPYWFKVFEVLVYLGCVVAFGIGMAKLQGTLLDKALIPGDRHALAVIMTILVGAFIVVSVTSLRQSYLTAYVSENVLREMRLRIFSLVQRLHPGFFQTMDTGDIMSRTTSDLAAVEMALSNSLVMGLRMALMLVAAVITIFFTDWKLAALVMLVTPLFLVTARVLAPKAAMASRERQQSLATAASALQENLGAQPVIKAFGLQQHAIGNYSRDLDQVFRSSLRLTFLAGLFGLSTSSIASAIQLLVLGLGAWLVIGGDLTTGTLFAFLALSAQVIGPMQSMTGVVQGLQEATGAMERVDDLLRAKPAIIDSDDARPLEPLSHQIRFEHVSFVYGDDQPVLRDLNLDIPAGSSVALVGPSGCGKSTVLNLLLRFYEAQRGTVSIDGVDVRKATLDSLRGQIGVVLQDNVLFNISVRDNIRLGRLDATDEEVEAAARAAEIHHLVLEMSDGYDTLVGERGSRLSGGQRQRVAIARAIIRNPALLLLDEATSALDPATEAAINSTLDRLSRGRTTVSVTHRLASVVNVDRIYVLDHGAVVEQGTHDELVAQGGLYARLWQEQGGGVIEAGVQYVGVEAARLQAVPLFANLDPDLLSSLAQFLAVERYPAGDTIVEKGQEGDKLYIIHRGRADVYASNPMTFERPLATLGEGDYFGEMALVSDRRRVATVRARTPLQLYSLDRREFLDLLHAQPRLAQQVMQVARQRYAEINSGPAAVPA